MPPRRKSAPPLVAIEICRSQIHLAVLSRTSDGRATVHVRTRIWHKDSASLASEAGRQELREAVSALVSEERLRGATAHVALSRDFCVTRVVAGLAGDVRQELKKVEHRAALYLGLGVGRKITATAVSPLDARHEHGLLAVANERVLDGLLAALHQAGLRPVLVEPSLLAISRALGQAGRDGAAPQLIVNLTEGGLELGISYRGQLLLDYRPGGRGGEEDTAAVVAQHFSRLKRYCARYGAQTAGRQGAAALSSAFLFGASEAVRAAQTGFEKTGLLAAEAFDPSTIDGAWQFQGDALAAEHSAVLGCCLAACQTGGEHRGPNLVAQIAAKERERLLPLLRRRGWPVAAMLLISLGLVTIGFLEQRRCAELAARIESLEPARAEAWRLEMEIAEAETKVGHLREIRAGIANPAWDRVLLTLAQCMPEGVWLNRLEVSANGKIAISGVCYDDAGAFELVRWLDRAPAMRDVQLEGMQPQRLASGPATAFAIKASLADSSTRGG